MANPYPAYPVGLFGGLISGMAYPGTSLEASLDAEKHLFLSKGFAPCRRPPFKTLAASELTEKGIVKRWLASVFSWVSLLLLGCHLEPFG